mgnify:CR=1 FL=1
MYCVKATYDEIKESNKLFAKAIKESIDSESSENMVEKAKSIYNLDTYIVKFNKENLYGN